MNPTDVRWLPDQPAVAITSFGGDQVRIVPPGATTQVAPGPVSVDPFPGGLLFVASRTAGLLQRIEPGSGTTTRAIPNLGKVCHAYIV